MENFNKQQTRDYDKNPIILKNYEYLYQKLLMVFSFFIGGVFAIIVILIGKPAAQRIIAPMTVYA